MTPELSAASTIRHPHAERGDARPYLAVAAFLVALRDPEVRARIAALGMRVADGG